MVSSTELAKALGLSPRSIQRYVKAGMIAPLYVTPGGHYRWSIADVVGQLREQRQRDEQN